MATIINPNTGTLFFINYTVNGLTRKEWRLVRMELNESLKLNPESLTNERLLAKFLVGQPENTEFSAII